MDVTIIAILAVASLAVPLLLAWGSHTGGLDRWQERHEAWSARHPRAAPWAASFYGGAAVLLLLAVAVAVWGVWGDPPLSPWTLLAMGVGYALLMRLVIAAAVGVAKKRAGKPHP